MGRMYEARRMVALGSMLVAGIGAAQAGGRGLSPDSGFPNGTPRPNYILTDCQEIPEMTPSSSAQRAVDPPGAIDVYITHRGGKSIRPESAAVTLIEKPKHGVLTEEVANTGYRFFGYDQKPGFVGKDRAVFLVEAGGERYKVVVTLVVTVGAAPDIPSPCPPARLKKLSDAGVRVSFTHLPGSSLGQSIGTTIALDATVAGYGWFID